MAQRITCILLLLAAPLLTHAESGKTLFDPDPQHPWNRLNSALFLRVAPDGKEFGLDELDILFWNNTTNLLGGSSKELARKSLDEFLSTHAETKILEPWKKAVLQRRLWELFDWSVDNKAGRRKDNSAAELQKRLAQVIRRVALTPREIQSLPDNYSIAEETGGLPRGLAKKRGDWLNLGIKNGDLTAIAHVHGFGGRSTFAVMMRHPAGGAAGARYLKRLNDVSPKWADLSETAFKKGFELNPKFPQFPAGTQWALVRRMCLIDTEGEIRSTHVVENIQVRTYLTQPEPIGGRSTLATSQRNSASQRFEEFKMSLAPGLPLIPVKPGEKNFEFIQFRGLGIDPFEHAPQTPAPDSARFKTETLRSCAECHGGVAGPGLGSINSFTRLFTEPPSEKNTTLIELGPLDHEAGTIDYKKRRASWRLLRSFWSPTSNPR